MNRILMIVLGLVAAGLLGGYLYLQIRFEQRIETGVRTTLSSHLDTEVKLEDVDISLLTGKGELLNLVIRNPAGNRKQVMIESSQTVVQVEVESMTTDTITINSVEMAELVINYEPAGATGSNLQHLLHNLRLNAGNDEPGGRRLIVDRLLIAKTRLRVHTPLSPAPLIVVMGALEWEGLGRKGDGLRPRELLEQVLARINAQALRSNNEAIRALQSRIHRERRAGD